MDSPSKEKLKKWILKSFLEQGAFSLLKRDKKILQNLIEEVCLRYKDNPYHNFFHAADTVRTMGQFLVLPKLKDYFSHEEKLLMLFTMLVHDIEHPGNDNAYEVNTNSPWAKEYDNQSVIENHSLAVSLKLLEDPQLNIFQGLPGYPDFIHTRLKTYLLSTDFGMHANYLARLEEEKPLEHPEDIEAKILVGSSVVKLVDISTVCKNFPQAEDWGQRITQEMKRQAFLEKKDFPSSQADFYNSQVAFIKFAAVPLCNFLVELEPRLKKLQLKIDKNIAAYQDLSSQELKDERTVSHISG